VHTQERLEGYFRLEWDLADQRTHRMARGRAFIVPVCVDATRESSAEVPESFQRVQWTRLPGGDTPPAFVARVQRLLSGDPSVPVRAHAPSTPTAAVGSPAAAPGWSTRVLSVAGVVVALATASYLAIERPWIAKPQAPSTPATSSAPAGFAPPPHSVAVLPFVNMSGDKEQEYFSDGLTEELLNSLSEINELQVAARTSAFSFKGKDADLGTIARKLNVGAILEGSVRRSGNTIRITVQLINATTGFHLWSKSYDRDLGDVLKLQTEIATAVAGALKVTLLGDSSQKIELGGTHSAAAFDAYLRGSKAYQSRHDTTEDLPPAIAAYTEAIRLDPNYALAFAGRSIAITTYTDEAVTGAAIHEGHEKAESDARRALALAPELAQAHMALAFVFDRGSLNFVRAGEEYERALALAPGNADVLRTSGQFAGYVGRFDIALASLRRAVALDPLNRSSHARLGNALNDARRYAEALTSYAEAVSLNPDFKGAYGDVGLAYYGLGDLEGARTACEKKPDYWFSQMCLAVVYDKLSRHADAEAQLAKMKAALSDAAAYQYATIYAQWGDRTKALGWLDTAVRLGDPGLIQLKVDPLMDPLRQEPRFQAALRELKFPE
jgi:TolB-like protein/Flp pilus assembly protein TadD